MQSTGWQTEALSRTNAAGVDSARRPRVLVADAPPDPAAPSVDPRSRWSHAVKRALDVLAGVSLLVITSPLCLVLAILIKLEDGGPVFFRQARIGRGGAPFLLRKFRSMAVDAEALTGPVWAQADDPRVTRVGRWMRPFGIDEIPQAWNVLRGEMSFVGPRPERPEFIETLEAAIPQYARRHLVRPGITGWAQVTLPYGSTLDDSRRKLGCDLYYVRNGSLRLDLAIMARTLRYAVRRRA